jgi:hypothetical protein
MATKARKPSTKTGKRKTPEALAPTSAVDSGSRIQPIDPAPEGPRAPAKVRVRMYRQGLGDCFLVTFNPGGEDTHMLIDCGTLGTSNDVKLSVVVADIRLTTKDHIALLVATHEHWDHVRAFHELEAEFKKIKFDHIWMAWTENPKDALAQTISKSKQDLGTALTAASAALTVPSATRESQTAGRAVQDLLGFFGDEAALGAAKFSEKLNEAMNTARLGLSVPAEFHNPGDGPIAPDWLLGFRFYVLGPPRDLSALHDTEQNSSSELYSMARSLEAAAEFRRADQNLAEYLANRSVSPQSAAFDERMPFDSRFCYAFSDKKTREAFYSSYSSNSESWRRVDDDWLHVASDLALQLDSATNNTSLALAIERVCDGKVLLFPADAQEGNWLSWHNSNMKWTSGNPAGKTVEITATDLLNRTVFYKVGHHSSHNATARAKGLELMELEQELVAFIPIDRAVALKRNPPGSWKMPAAPLYRRLLEKCQGRVVRSDIGWVDDARNAKDPVVEQQFVDMATPAEWTKWKQSQIAAKNVAVSPLYVDYLLD